MLRNPARSDSRAVSTGASYHPLAAVCLVVLSALVVAACGTEFDADAAGSAPSTSAAAEGQPTGTLTLGDRTLEFRVTVCDLSDREATSADEMLQGFGTRGDGTRFSVILDRQLWGSQAVHSVNVYSGAPPTGFFAEAQWQEGAGIAGADASGPLIRIDGTKVHAQGTFKVDDAGEESVVEGVLEATCPERRAARQP